LSWSFAVQELKLVPGVRLRLDDLAHGPFRGLSRPTPFGFSFFGFFASRFPCCSRCAMTFSQDSPGSSQGPADCAAELYHTGETCCCFLQLQVVVPQGRAGWPVLCSEQPVWFEEIGQGGGYGTWLVASIKQRDTITSAAQ